MNDLNAAMEAAVSSTLQTIRGGGGTDDVQRTTIALTNAVYGYDLSPAMKQFVPFLPSWVRSIPRILMGTGNAHEYKRITKVSTTGKSTAAEGTRGNAGVITADSKSVSLGIVSSGVFDVTLEAEKAAGNFDNAIAIATSNMLLHGMRAECGHILGGTVSALGAVTTPTITDSATPAGGNATGQTYYFYIKSLTAMALQKAKLGGIVAYPTGAYNSVAPIASATADQTDGWGVESAVVNAAGTTGHSLLLTWDANPKALAYAIFMGTTAGGGTGITNALLQCVVCQTSVCLTSISATGVAAISGDNSADANDYLGILALMNASGSGAYIKNVGAALTAATGSGIPEIDTMIATCYENALGIDDGFLVCGTQDRAYINRKLGAGTATSLIKWNMEARDTNTFTGGAFVDTYMHPITGRVLPIVTDPYMSYGTMLWIPKNIPYPQANIPGPLAMHMSYDWYSLAYAVVNPKREFENRCRGGLAMYLPPAFGQLYNYWQV